MFMKRKVLIFMYVVDHVWDYTGYRLDVRLATGLGGLKSIWILAPVAIRFSGRYRMVSKP